jgi:hypothetical protein
MLFGNTVSRKRTRPLWSALTCGAVAMTLCLSAHAKRPNPYVETEVVADTDQQILLEFNFDQYQESTVRIGRQAYRQIALGHEGIMLESGAPALPHVARSIVIPDDAQMSIRLVDDESSFYELTDIDIAPSKGILYRNVDPDTVPYAFGDAYHIDAFYPGKLVELRDPYILRDHRGVVVDLFPFQYNPATRTLRVYTTMMVDVRPVGPGKVNVLRRNDNRKSLRSFNDVYRTHFLNDRGTKRYDPLDEVGEMLIIANDPWVGTIQPFADHKSALGIPTTVVSVSSIGNNATSIKNYIQNMYNTSDLAFVLLVGDSQHIASPLDGSDPCDPQYAKVAGADDYPDIFVGRFSAETSAQVETQMQRVIEYELGFAPTQDWYWKGTGIASNQGPGDDGEYDNEHEDNIRDLLLANGYTHVDQIYDPTASAAQVANVLNDGRGVVNYTGHGSSQSWSSSGFSSSDVNALTNNGMLPFIWSVACVNGDFDGQTCFAEAWLRATNSGQPSGAVGVYMSSINQSWDPPMEAQDEFNFCLVDQDYLCYGGLCCAGSCSMIDVYGSGGVEMYDTWHIFGDPSLRVIGTVASDQGRLTLGGSMCTCDDLMPVRVSDVGLNTNPAVIETVSITATSDSDMAGETFILTEVTADSPNFEGTIALSGSAGSGTVLVAHGDQIDVLYMDADDGQGGINVPVYATATVDCQSPSVVAVSTIDIEPRAATVQVDADEVVSVVAKYGVSCGALTQTTAPGGFGDPAQVVISGLQDNTTYYYHVEVTDEAGNLTVDDNGGLCYMFATPEIPDFFTQEYSGPLDLENMRLWFMPNGTVDHYAACIEDIGALPTDPAGGTSVSYSEDGYQLVSLTGGAQVTLYGVSYSSFYICDNGYLTFGGSDGDYTPTLADHFDMPRISAFFNDFTPSGTVSYKQLADRVVVTYLNVAEYNTSNSSTFQIELFYDGTITLAYLSMDASGGIVGLSEGDGVNPDFYPSEFITLPSCGEHPPFAEQHHRRDAGQHAGSIELLASDDGLPDPPGALTYIITSLPDDGMLLEGLTQITAVPYVLAGNMVDYMPNAMYQGPDGFTFKANDGGVAPDGGDSPIAMVSITVGVPAVVYEWLMDSDPGWSTTGQWAYGVPTGGAGTGWGGTSSFDPTSGYTGTAVYGYNLAGGYADDMGEETLTSTAIDCTNLTDVQVRFMRWLGVNRPPTTTRRSR